MSAISNTGNSLNQPTLRKAHKSDGGCDQSRTHEQEPTGRDLGKCERAHTSRLTPLVRRAGHPTQELTESVNRRRLHRDVRRDNHVLFRAWFRSHVAPPRPTYL